MYSQPLCEAASFDELCTMLETHYGASRSVAIDKKRLKERRRGKGESYADLGQDILRLARRAAPELAEKEAHDYY